MRDEADEDAGRRASAVRRLITGVTAALFAAATGIAYASVVGYVQGPPFSRGLGVAALVSGRRVWDVPVEFFGLVWFAALFAAHAVEARWYRGRARPAVDRLAFYASIPVAAALGAVIATAPSRSWLLTAALVPACVLLVVTARGLDKGGRPETHAGLLAYPRIVVVLVVLAVAAYASGRTICALVRVGGGVPAYQRQLPGWLGTLDRASDSVLVPGSGVRTVVFVDDRPVGSSDFEAYRALIAARQKVGASVEWREIVVPRKGVCQPAGLGAACDPTLALLLLTKMGLRRGARFLREELARGTEDPAAVAQRRLAEEGLATRFAASSESLRLELGRNQELATRLALATIPAMFVNGIRLRGPTPDLFDGVVGHLLSTTERTATERR